MIFGFTELMSFGPIPVLPCLSCAEETVCLLKEGAGNGNGHPLTAYNMSHTSHHCQSMSIIACREGGAEEIVSQWSLGSDGDLELPRPVPGTKYYMQVSSSDGKSERVHLRVASCMTEVVQSEPS